jgi:hypothetical protein
MTCKVEPSLVKKNLSFTKDNPDANIQLYCQIYGTTTDGNNTRHCRDLEGALWVGWGLEGVRFLSPWPVYNPGAVTVGSWGCCPGLRVCVISSVAWKDQYTWTRVSIVPR